MRADGEGGILFYIILGIVGLIVSYLQNKAKPKQSPTNDIPDEPKDIWRELMDWEEVNEPEKQMVEVNPKDTIQKNIEVPSLESNVVMDAVHEGTSAFTSKPVTIENAYQITEQPVAYYDDLIKDTEISDAVEEMDSSNKFVFKLREAVIYSEILNRKY